jgi:hypothetical protein
MEEKHARQLASEWVGAHENPQEWVDVYEWFAGELGELLSDEVTAGVAEIDGRPAVVAVESERFCRLAVTDHGEGQVRISVGFLPIDGLVLGIESVIEARREATVRQRSWTLRPLTGDTVTVKTREPLMQAWSVNQRMIAGELAMRELARRAGVPLAADRAEGEVKGAGAG